ncbi:cyclin-dependent kinases regulatory subunit 1 isoform X2 [Vigna radiata var. radiata]|uniref:Cyclin-dependent kinases regulatory subunit n=1 Tax=Vigna radiata var. radiata TaxID=3916 RepID=A0A3Q0EQX4_VIGRR|nr:cyclin-dependent kinases regulatory subunit 1 isoform X2 [Vigna radiata var. radiata]
MGQIQYSEKYFDDTYEYRHVVLPPEVAKMLPKNRLLSENEWRAIGVSRVVVFLCNFCGARAISVLFFYLRLLNFLL